jgi:hypothetical protein
MKENGNNENVCFDLKEKLNECASVAFRMVNTSRDYSW